MRPAAIAVSLVLVVALGAPAGAAAQQATTLGDELEDDLGALLRALNATDSVADREQVLLQRSRTAILKLAYDLTRPDGEDLRTLEANRVDKQTGSGAGSSGSTSLVSKGGVPALIGFAVENGALEQRVSGTTITVRGNAYGFTQLVRGEIESAFLEAPLAPSSAYLRRFSFAASFDASRGNDEGDDPVFRGDRQQLASFSVRYEPLNHRAPWTGAYQERFEDVFEGRLVPLVEATERAYRVLRDQDWYQEEVLPAWAREAADALGTGSVSKGPLLDAIDDLDERIRARTEEELAGFDDALDALLEAESKLLFEREEILEVLGKGAILALEYGNERPVDLPTLSTVKLIAETGLWDGTADLTVNADLRLWNSTEEFLAVGRQIDTLRDWSVAAQLDVPVGAVAQGRPLVLSFAARLVRMRSLLATPPKLRETGMAPIELGDPGSRVSRVLPVDETQWVGQAKLTIPIKEAGVRVPLSVSVSNRPELLEDETDVRGNVGFTLDLDALFGSTAARR